MKLALALLGFLLGLVPAAAQDWPTKTVRIMVPFGPGSTPDMVARLIAERLAAEARPGIRRSRTSRAPAAISAPMRSPRRSRTAPPSASRSAARSPSTPCCSRSSLTTRPRTSRGHAIWSPSRACSRSMRTSASTASASSSRCSKREPGKHNFGSIGNGSLSHLAMEAIALKSGTKMVHVPYPGSPQAITAVLRGDVQMACLPAISVTPQVASGKVKIFAVSTGQTLGAAAGRSDLEGSGDRRGGRRLDGTDRARQDAGCGDRQDQPRGGRRRSTLRRRGKGSRPSSWSRSATRPPNSAP